VTEGHSKLSMNRPVLVLGPSSVGKSSYISARRYGAHGNPAPVVMGTELDAHRAMSPAGPCPVIHYNMLHPFEGRVSNADRSLEELKPLRHVFEKLGRVDVDILVAKPATLIKRALLRTKIEPGLRSHHGRYPSLVFVEFFLRADLPSIYRRWVDYLWDNCEDVRFLSTEGGDYRELGGLGEAVQILSDPSPVEYSEEERRVALKWVRTTYQDMGSLGIDVEKAGGTSRQATFGAIRPHVRGTSVLDVGCAQGFFCFALAGMGKQPVVGTELKHDRFMAAAVVNEVTGRRCEFHLRDIAKEPLGRTFDTVLLLNVLHHMPDPVGGLRACAGHCRERLIIEMVTPEDRIFRSSLERGAVLPKGPFIGVSLLKEKDQTFVFTEEALRRVLVSVLALFERVEFYPSPISATRRIAVCTKSG
jgi:SAM-dependent methyltransferase